MNILLANPRGFCAGVVMAIDAVERTEERPRGHDGFEVRA